MRKCLPLKKFTRLERLSSSVKVEGHRPQKAAGMMYVQ